MIILNVRFKCFKSHANELEVGSVLWLRQTISDVFVFCLFVKFMSSKLWVLSFDQMKHFEAHTAFLTHY